MPMASETSKSMYIKHKRERGIVSREGRRSLHPMTDRSEMTTKRRKERKGGTSKNGSLRRDATRDPRDAGATPGDCGRLSRLGPGFHAQVVDFPHIARGKMFSRHKSGRSPSPQPSPPGEGEAVSVASSWSRSFCGPPSWNRNVRSKIMMKIEIRRDGI
jgi:hypothetical protein